MDRFSYSLKTECESIFIRIIFIQTIWTNTMGKCRGRTIRNVAFKIFPGLLVIWIAPFNTNLFATTTYREQGLKCVYLFIQLLKLHHPPLKYSVVGSDP